MDPCCLPAPQDVEQCLGSSGFHGWALNAGVGMPNFGLGLMQLGWSLPSPSCPWQTASELSAPGPPSHSAVHLGNACAFFRSSTLALSPFCIPLPEWPNVSLPQSS